MQMIVKTTAIEILKELQKILDLEKINYSLGLANFYEYKNEPELFLINDVEVCLWHTDFYALLKKYPNQFVLPENLAYKSLAPYYKFSGSSIKINIIVGTNDEKINYWYKFKNYKRLIYWGNSKKHWLYYLLGSKTQRISLHDLVNSLVHERYTKFIILNSEIDKFKVFDNLNFNKRFFVTEKGITVPFFEPFKAL
ncbi:hypothetical protein J7894_02195 [Mycoplasmopsis agalactiae]|nr:hypothetical protein [Mycoplasmopsis agalactiae]MCE6090859.1 hypothetical protein [Mycoplasmopsis agalactiae]